MSEKIITCADSCYFCTRSGWCPHFGEDGYHCHRYDRHDCRDENEGSAK